MGAPSSETSRGMPRAENIRARARATNKESRSKKELPRKTRERLLKAGKELQKKEGRKALRILAGETINEKKEKEMPIDYAKEREKLGLKKEETLQEIALRKDRRRKEAADIFLENKKEDSAREIPPTYEEMLKKGREKVRSIHEVLPQKVRRQISVDRARALATLTIKGVKNPEKVLQILEAEHGNEGILKNVNVESIVSKDYSAEFETNRAAEDFKDMYERARSNDFITICKKVENVPVVSERMHQIGARFSLEGNHSNGSEELLTMAQELAKIPKEQFIQVSNDLLRYKFLFPEKNQSIEDNLAFKPLIDFISETNEITIEQRQILENADRIYKIGATRYNRQDFHPLLSTHNPSELFKNKERLADEVIVLEQLILEVDSPNMQWAKNGIANNSHNIANKLNLLNENNDLHLLAETIRNGFSIGSENTHVIIGSFSSSDGRKTLEDVQVDIRRSNDILSKFSTDKSLLSKILFLDDLRQMQYPDNEVLSIGRSKLFEFCSNHGQSSEQIIKLALDFADCSRENQHEKAMSINSLIKFDDDLGMSLSIESIFNDIKIKPAILEKLPEEENFFWQTVVDWKENKFSWLGSSDDIISVFLVQNQSRFIEFYKDNRLTDTFFNEFTNYFKRIPDNYYIRVGNKLLKQTNNLRVNKFLLDQDQVPLSIRDLSTVLSGLSNTERESVFICLGENFGQWSQFVSEGRPTIMLISSILDSQTTDILTANKLLTDDLMDSLPENESLFWSKWKEMIHNKAGKMSIFLYKNREKFADFYQKGDLTPLFLEQYFRDIFQNGLEMDTVGLKNLLESGAIDKFPKKDFALWTSIGQSNMAYESRKFALEHIEEIKNYFNENGEPSAQLLTYLAKSGKVEVQEAFLSDSVLNSFSENDQNFWRGWRNLPGRGKEIFNQKLNTSGQITENLIKEIRVFESLFEEINKSPSQELQKIKDQLIPLLLENSQPEEALKKIISLFERNNLPDFGKKFRIFEILYYTPETDGRNRFDREITIHTNLSPTLQKSSRLRRLDTIYKDLLRINIDSGDASLKNYLIAMKEGQEILDKFEIEGVDNLSPTELRKMTRFLNRLNVLFENSLLGRQNKKKSSPLPEPLDLKTRIANLKDDLQLKDGQKVIDRVLEMFVKPLGYESIDAVLIQMDKAKQQAHDRNLTNPRVQEGQLEINAGDLLKGIENDVLGYILQNGSVAREYIGVSADSDSTPFDIDTGMVLKEDLEGGLPHILGASPAQGYGDLALVFRNRGQFTRNDQQENLDLRYNQKKYELFFSGYIGERHYGVRTGLPSTELDAVIMKQPLLNDEQGSTLKREGIFFNIANNGFYIPVVNPEGKVIFTEADYNLYRLDQQKITENLTGPEFKPSEFIDLLKSSPYLKTIYEMSAGVGEGYTTEQHTTMGMEQFEKYFSSKFKSSFLTREDFRLLFAFHDIGKPVAFYSEGSTYAQHEYTKKVLSYALQATGIQSSKADTIVSLVDQDILGEYFQGKVEAQKSAEQINDLSETIGVPVSDLIDILKMYFICDAGSYTADAGGQVSLDSAFVFKHENGGNEVNFSSEIEIKYQELLSLINK